MLILFSLKNDIISEVLPVAILFVNKHPTLLRMMFGLYKSVFGLAMITASTLAASAVRSNAPMFPGFSGASAMRIRGWRVVGREWFVGSRFSKDNFLAFAIAKIPSVEPR